MKIYGLIRWLWLFVLLSFNLQGQQLKTVESLDLNQYMGTWHQVAAIPAWFQRQCYRNVTAQYKQLNSQIIHVTNRCEKKDGSFSVAQGRARLNSEYNITSKLQVTFAQIFQKWWWTVAGDYWVIELADDYSYSVVGDPDRKYLWVLSREKFLSHQIWQDLSKKISQHGYDTCQIILTQGDDLNGTQLCKTDGSKSLLSRL